MNVNAVANMNGEKQAVETENRARTSGTGFSNYMDQQSLRYGDYLEQIFDEASNTYNVSKDLLKAMAKAESNFRADATSSCGAMGIMQLMPGTAAGLGVSDAYDPKQNIMGGAKYMSQLLSKYNNNLTSAIAAYNAGSGNVDKYGGIPPFKETQNYVVKVLQYLEEGVTIPDSSGTASNSSGMPVQLGNASNASAQLLGSANNASAQLLGATNNTGSNTSALQQIVNQYFDYDDYLEFLQLFTKVIYEKLSEEAGMQKDTESNTQNTAQKTETVSKQETDVQVQPQKQLTMTVRDSHGSINTYHQQSQDSDAYTAYQTMTAGGKNRLSVMLNRTLI